jgi:hypothetical protein
MQTSLTDDSVYREFFVCKCGNVEDHVIFEVVRYKWNDDEICDHDLTVHVQMNHFLPWYKRLYRAFLYVIAKNSTWYHYSETLISVEDAVRMRDILDKYIEEKNQEKLDEQTNT